MSAQRKKGKKSQNAESAQPDNAKDRAVSGTQVSDNTESPVETAFAAALEKTNPAPAAPERTSAAPSDGAESGSETASTAAAAEIDAPAAPEETVGAAPEAASEGNAQSALSEKPAEPAAEESAIAETGASAPASAPAAETSAPTDTPAASPHQEAAPAAPGEVPKIIEDGGSNFDKSEVRTLLVPVKPLHRLIACTIVIVCFSFLGHLVLKAPPSVNAQGLHTVDFPEAGSYVLFFRGDLEDPYGWAIDGRYRNSLEIELEPIEPFQKVVKIDPMKDLSGADFFSVAEYEINPPGKYNLWIKWNNPANMCKGKIYLEKDPVEKFIFKWAFGIVGTIALFFMIGIPMTTSKAQATLPGQQ